MSEAEELVVDSENDGKGEIIGYAGNYIVYEKDNSIPYQMSKEETEMWHKAMSELAAALKKRGKTLGDLL